jgi:hypothetical protein
MRCVHIVLLPVLSACSAQAPEPCGFEATPDEEIATVLHVRGFTTAPAAVTIEHGPDTSYGRTLTLSAEPATEHTGTLLGLPAGQEWHWRIRAEADGAVTYGPDRVSAVPNLPDDLPAFAVQSFGDQDAGPFVLTSWHDVPELASWAIIVDGLGRVVWYARVDGRSFTPHLSRDGAAILMLVAGIGEPNADAPPTRIVRIPLTGGDRMEWEAPGGHHAFVELPEGGFAYMAEDVRDIDGQDVKADLLVEQPDEGPSRIVWDAFEALPFQENDGWAEDPADFSHANALLLVDDTYFFSLYRQAQLHGVDRTSGQTRFIVDGATHGFGPQHSPHLVGAGLADGFLLFDNGTGGPSRVVRYDLDPTTGVVAERSSWNPMDVRVTVMGASTYLPDGGSVTTLGDAARMLRTDASGGLRWEVSVDSFGVLGDVEVLEDFGG